MLLFLPTVRYWCIQRLNQLMSFHHMMFWPIKKLITCQETKCENSQHIWNGCILLLWNHDFPKVIINRFANVRISRFKLLYKHPDFSAMMLTVRAIPTHKLYESQSKISTSCYNTRPQPLFDSLHIVQFNLSWMLDWFIQPFTYFIEVVCTVWTICIYKKTRFSLQTSATVASTSAGACRRCSLKRLPPSFVS